MNTVYRYFSAAALLFACISCDRVYVFCHWLAFTLLLEDVIDWLLVPASYALHISYWLCEALCLYVVPYSATIDVLRRLALSVVCYGGTRYSGFQKFGKSKNQNLWLGLMGWTPEATLVDSVRTVVLAVQLLSGG